MEKVIRKIERVIAAIIAIGSICSLTAAIIIPSQMRPVNIAVFAIITIASFAAIYILKHESEVTE